MSRGPACDHVRVSALKRPTLTRAAVLATVATLGLAGCSGGEPDASESPSSSPSPTPTVSIPQGASLTEQGSDLSFGDQATVVFEARQKAGTAAGDDGEVGP